jgi:hypothetical protein
VWAVGAATVLAGLLRLLGLTRQSMWVDEGSTIAFTQRGLDGMWHLLVDYESNALVYYLLVYPLARLDDSLASLRALSAIAGVLAVPALYWAARPLLARLPLLFACAALSLNSFAVTQSQYARAYALVMLASILSYGFLLRTRDEGGRRSLLLYALTVALVVYLNSLCGLLLLASQVLVPLARGRRAVGRWLLAVAGITVLVAPLAALTASAASGRDPFYWVDRPGLLEVARAQALIMGGPVAGACSLLLLAGALLHARRRLPRSMASALAHPATAVAGWAFAPIAVLLVISLAKPVFSDQYLTPAVPGLCLLLGLAIASLPRRAGVWSLGVLLAALAVGIVDHARRQYFEDWRAPIRQLTALREPGDPVIFDTQLGVVPAGYYDRAFTSPGGRLYVSEWKDSQVPADVTLLGNPLAHSGVAEGPPGVALVRRLSSQTGRLFLVVSHTNGQGDVLRQAGPQWLDAHCRTHVHRYKAVTLVAARACPA